MIEPEHEDLVNREIDGRTTPEEQASLRELVRTRPEVKAYRDALQNAARALGAAGLEEPPPQMIGEIMGRVREKPRGRARVERIHRGPGRAVAVRYALALAAGLALGAVSVALVGGGLLQWGAGGEGLGATMLAGDRLGGAREIDRAAIDLPGLEGEVAAKRAGDVVLAEIRIDAPQAAELTLAFDPAALSPVGLERLGSAAGEATLSPSGLRLAWTGEGRWRLLLKSLDDRAPSALRLRLAADGRVVEKTLETRAGP